MKWIAISVVLALIGGCAPTNVPTDELLIARVLERHYDDGGYTVVDPETTLSHLNEERWGITQAQTREELRAELALAGFAAGPLVDSLFDKNAQPVRLTIDSDPARGYVVDHDGKFRGYFGAKDGRGWQRWYAENPEAHGLTEVSLPAYDQASGLMLIYIGTQRHGDDGSGYLVLYHLEDGQLKKAWSWGLWIS